MKTASIVFRAGSFDVNTFHNGRLFVSGITAVNFCETDIQILHKDNDGTHTLYIHRSDVLAITISETSEE